MDPFNPLRQLRISCLTLGKRTPRLCVKTTARDTQYLCQHLNGIHSLICGHEFEYLGDVASL